MRENCLLLQGMRPNNSQSGVDPDRGKRGSSHGQVFPL